jgi:hypothetical protein
MALERNHEWFGLDTLKGQGSISGKAVEERFKALIDSDITLHITPASLSDSTLPSTSAIGYGMTVPVQILCWRIVVKVTILSSCAHDGHGEVQWQFKPKHGEGTVWIDSTSDEYSVIS